jgi:hypothetical protein
MSAYGAVPVTDDEALICGKACAKLAAAINAAIEDAGTGDTRTPEQRATGLLALITEQEDVLKRYSFRHMATLQQLCDRVITSHTARGDETQDDILAVACRAALRLRVAQQRWVAILKDLEEELPQIAARLSLGDKMPEFVADLKLVNGGAAALPSIISSWSCT